jgi:hypothetical protein
MIEYSPDYMASEEEILTEMYGIDWHDYYMSQDVCCQTVHKIRMRKTA